MLYPLLDKIYYHGSIRTSAPAELAIENYGYLLVVGANDCTDQPDENSRKHPHL